ncbi:DMT family transporter [Archaeoglobus veneficus]|uniref:EamA domain-containing protein n=1 Tax=Archaeoglobus veneficus (strain DSM 11195 / SNP6) TaxID=693661 RepID=F2KN69_ARCVS|nr:DMT family transporter [Archaeoglobus veneficus]AEA46170.1 protein of unknown function DUF6 transmembrane [Archaeoglobus veneficus SNP6]
MARRLYIAALFLTMLIWAGSFIAIKIALRELSPFNLAFYRFLIATPLMLIACRNLRLPELKDLPNIVVLALTGVTLLYAVQFLALKLTTATNASILINTCAIFIALMSYILLGERFTGLKVAGIIVSFVGVVMIISNGFNAGFSGQTALGDVLMVFDGLLWAIYTVLGKRLLEKYGAGALTAYAFAAGTFLLLPFALYEGIEDIFSLTPQAWASLLYLSVLCSVFAYVVWYAALSHMDATEVAVFVYLVPLFTAIMAVFLLGEEITPFIAVGGVLTIAGVYMVEQYSFRHTENLK